jgi:ribonuclease BN (tRNA processing enzyme)
VKLHFLGTTGYHPNNHRQTACLMLPEIGVIFDAGTGMFRVRDLIQTDTLDIFLSHVHLDHCVGLTFLYDILYEKEMSRVTVHIDSGKIPTIENHLYNSLLFPVKPNFELRPLAGNVELTDGQAVTSFELEHPGGCHGFRVQGNGLDMAYVTDTTADEHADYVSEISGVETLVHECYFPDGWEERASLTGHSCLTPVAKVAARANAKKLFLVHINPLDESDSPLDLESVAEIHSNVVTATDQMVVEIG